MFNTHVYPAQFVATFEDGSTKRFEGYYASACWKELVMHCDKTGKDLADWKDVSPNAAVTAGSHILD
ncbi:hypothetical protein [Roseobacter phage RDJL6]|nr:hypothetical protein [Roseobacter phage RDJL6]